CAASQSSSDHAAIRVISGSDLALPGEPSETSDETNEMVIERNMPERRAVFLDRDGVLVIPEMRDGRSYAPRNLDDFRFYPGAKDALRRLKEAGYLLVVVTNQPDVGKGLILKSTVDQMHDRIRKELSIDRIEVCPHVQADECPCRKPKPGMLLEAARE